MLGAFKGSKCMHTCMHARAHTQTHVEWRGGLNGPSLLARDCILTMGALLVPENMTQIDPCRGQDGLLLSSLPCVGDEGDTY